MNAIEMRNITMTFGNFKANDDITLTVKKGEVHALIGENGAGKSTLMSILFGLYKQTAGQILINGKAVTIDSPLHANDLGIGMVHQHFKLVDDFTVMQNIVLNDENTVFGIFTTMKESRKKAEEIIRKYKFDLDLDKKVADCSVAEQQRTEIIKMLYRDAEILIFDEPTAVLSPEQIKDFLLAIKDLQSKGKTIILISHKLDELKEVANMGTIIRRGKKIDVVNIKAVTPERLAELMVGSKVPVVANKHEKFKVKTIFKINDLSVPKHDKPSVLGLKNFDLRISEGEIVAIAGVEGNGQTELINAITGLQHIKGGAIELEVLEGLDSTTGTKYSNFEEFRTKSIHKQNAISKKIIDMAAKQKSINKKVKKRIEGLLAFTKNEKTAIIQEKSKLKAEQIKAKNKLRKVNTKQTIDKLNVDLDKLKEKTNNVKAVPVMKDISRLSIKKKYAIGMAHIPEDRQKYGLVLDMNLNDNSVIQEFYKWPFSKYGFMNNTEIKKFAGELIDNFDVRSSDGANSLTRTMSGGNQQKFIVARELSKVSSLLIIAQPTRGLDVGAITNIHSYILKAKAANKAILLISYELDEVMSLADRIVVLNSGEKVGEVPAKGVTKQKLGVLMAGKTKGGK